MTVTEFSNSFDVKLTAHRFPKEYGLVDNVFGFKLDEYEKSVYLTKAQNDLIIELYSGRNMFGRAYEQTEELRRYLSDLNVSKIIDQFETIESDREFKYLNCDIGDNVLFITREECLVCGEDPCYSRSWISCIPVRRDEFNTVRDNPFRNNKVWRLDLGISKVQLVSKKRIIKYKVDYIKKLTPIILEDIAPLTIEGESDVSQCKLHPALHESILERAVQYAIADIISKFPSQEE